MAADGGRGPPSSTRRRDYMRGSRVTGYLALDRVPTTTGVCPVHSPDEYACVYTSGRSSLTRDTRGASFQPPFSPSRRRVPTVILLRAGRRPAFREIIPSLGAGFRLPISRMENGAKREALTAVLLAGQIESMKRERRSRRMEFNVLVTRGRVICRGQPSDTEEVGRVPR